MYKLNVNIEESFYRYFMYLKLVALKGIIKLLSEYLGL